MAVTNDYKIELFPNPASTELTIITFPTFAGGEVITNITLSNLLGQTVYTHEYHSSQVQVDIAGLPKGIYFIKVNSNYAGKFVKE